ncbi:MAG: LuxR C-terminal-related transcriptional regulator [Candidatus Phaeomarinobacter sp.]
MRVVVADDHALVRDGLRLLVQSAYRGCDVVEAASFGDILSALREQGTVDLIITDFTMEDMHASAGLRAVKRSAPLAPLIVISARDDMDAQRITYKSGAAAFIEKTRAHEKVLETIERVLAGERLFAPGISSTPQKRHTDDGATPLDELTPRQQQVLALLGRGLSNKEIAIEIGIEAGTVKVYVNAIFKALGVHNRTQAALVAKQAAGESTKPTP